MTKPATRSPRVRALEKLQKILTRGFRNNALGYEQFFWREGTAVLRSPYDLGASKAGSLLLRLGPKNEILEAICDDAGPHWDCSVEESAHWNAINTWATDILNRFKREHVEPMPAEEFVQSLWRWSNLDAQSNVLLRAMVREQWDVRPGLAPLQERLLPSTLTVQEWYRRAQYMSEALNMEKRLEAAPFEHNGTTLDAKHMLAWMVALTFEREDALCQTQEGAVGDGDAKSEVYLYARMLRRAKNDNQIEYEWTITPDPERPNSLFASLCSACVVLEIERGPFTCVHPNRKLSTMTTQARIDCTKEIHDLLLGRERPMDADAAFQLDCARLSSIGKTTYIATCDTNGLRAALNTVTQEWWGSRNPAGTALMAAIKGLYPWDEMVERRRREAFAVLVQMAEMALPSEHMDLGPAGYENLFDTPSATEP